MQHHSDLIVDNKKSILIIDEPTSKLDSHNATKLIFLLQKLARAGASVLFSIHQPSSEIFQAIDHVILLHKGPTMGLLSLQRRILASAVFRFQNKPIRRIGLYQSVKQGQFRSWRRRVFI
jgi:ABC-type multidrug transport system ATPase subunit